ncbi:MAG: arginine repressor [Leptolyngbya sp. PLA1]|nr:arginine repressor [Leptolyngbya sp. PLA1]
MESRQRRHSLIRKLVASGPVRSQAALSSMLRRQGVTCTQATLSRDLRELGMVKGANGYAEPGVAPAKPGTLARVVQALLLKADAAGTLVVIRTPPGAAPSLALELDRTPPEGVVGTIAGDDTVFAATGSTARAGRVARLLGDMARAARPNDTRDPSGVWRQRWRFER